MQHDRHVGGVEETDWVATAHASLSRTLDWDLDTEALEIDDCCENSDCAEQVHDVGEVRSVECLFQSSCLVWPCDEKVEESDDCALKLFAAAGVDCGWGEGPPDDGFANASGDEQRDTGSKTIAFLQELIEQNDDETGNYQLDNQKEADAGTEVGWLAVEAGQDENAGLAEREDDGKELLGGLVQFAVGFEVQVDIDQMSTGKELGWLASMLSDSRGLAHTWKTIPDEMMGVVPNSIRVPLLLANIIRSQ